MFRNTTSKDWASHHCLAMATGMTEKDSATGTNERTLLQADIDPAISLFPGPAVSRVEFADMVKSSVIGFLLRREASELTLAS